MFHLMETIKTNISNLYECEFTSDESTRRIKVVAATFGVAAFFAYSHASKWEDVDKFELTSITLFYPVVIGS